MSQETIDMLWRNGIWLATYVGFSLLVLVSLLVIIAFLLLMDR